MNKKKTIAFLWVVFVIGMFSFSGLDLAFAKKHKNPPGPQGGPGTDWANPPGPAGGPGTSPLPKVTPAMAVPAATATTTVVAADQADKTVVSVTPPAAAAAKWWIPQKPYKLWKKKNLIEQIKKMENLKGDLIKSKADPAVVAEVDEQIKEAKYWLDRMF